MLLDDGCSADAYMICSKDMKIRTTLFTLLLLSFAALAEVQKQWVISAEEWSRPRHGERLVRMSPLVKSVQSWMARPGYKLLIRYPGGEEGAVWAQELRDWLVSLGIPSARTVSLSGLSRDDVITITILNDKELVP
jgi:hypothetical protein